MALVNLTATLSLTAHSTGLCGRGWVRRSPEHVVASLQTCRGRVCRVRIWGGGGFEQTAQLLWVIFILATGRFLLVHLTIIHSLETHTLNTACLAPACLKEKFFQEK